MSQCIDRGNEQIKCEKLISAIGSEIIDATDRRPMHHEERRDLILNNFIMGEERNPAQYSLL